MPASSADFAYAAGFFDGEGSVVAQRIPTHGSYALRVVIGNTCESVLRWLQDRWGGRVREWKRARDEWKDIHTWMLHGPVACSFLADVRPYLKVKSRQADVGWELGSICHPKGYRTRLTDDERWQRDLLARTLRRLNKRGKAT